MVAYRTKVTVRTKGKIYEPGSILPADLSASDIAFLKSKKFLEVIDAPSVVTDPVDDEDADGEEFGGENNGVDNGEGFDGFDEMKVPEYKSDDEIKKLKSKKAVYDYAASIGFDLGDDYDKKALAELHDAVINFQAEQMDGQDD